MVKVISKWYHEGAPPVWKVQCSECNRIYRILETQTFICDCLKGQIFFDASQVVTDQPAPTSEQFTSTTG